MNALTTFADTGNVNVLHLLCLAKSDKYDFSNKKLFFLNHVALFGNFQQSSSQFDNLCKTLAKLIESDSFWQSVLAAGRMCHAFKG